MIFCVLQVFVCRQPQDRRFLLVNAGPEVGCGVKEHVTWWQYSTWLYKERVDMELTSRAYEQEQLYRCTNLPMSFISLRKENKCDFSCLHVYWFGGLYKTKGINKIVLLLICFWTLICLERLSFIFGWLIVIIRMC